MSVINRNVILSQDVIFKGKLSSDKYLDMVYYEDSIRIPSQRVIDHFGERTILVVFGMINNSKVSISFIFISF
jgi:hypothetical protein